MIYKHVQLVDGIDYRVWGTEVIDTDWLSCFGRALSSFYSIILYNSFALPLNYNLRNLELAILLFNKIRPRVENESVE